MTKCISETSGEEDDYVDEGHISRKRLKTTTSVASVSNEPEAEWGGTDDVAKDEYGNEDAKEHEQYDESAEEHSVTSAATGASKNSGVGDEARSSEGVGLITVTLTDPDVLDCPICFHSLTVPVFQCENGHIACTSCCTKMVNCPSCYCQIGHIRCLAIEKVVESVKISCRNVEYGCEETFRYSKKHEHETACVHSPCLCPVEDCAFLGSSSQLFLHVSERHCSSIYTTFILGERFTIHLQKSQKCLILCEMRLGMTFVLNHRAEHHGSAVNVVCIGSPQSNRCLNYYIEYVIDERSRLVIHSSAESVPGWSADDPLKRYLFIPSNFLVSCREIKLEFCLHPWP